MVWESEAMTPTTEHKNVTTTKQRNKEHEHDKETTIAGRRIGAQG